MDAVPEQSGARGGALLKTEGGGGVRVWLFYAGPESYLDTGGERRFEGVLRWSSCPDVTPGDLALLYRRSLSKFGPSVLAEATGMTEEIARDIKRRGVGSDIAALWRVTSRNVGPLYDWSASCLVEHLAFVTPPVTIRELKAVAALRRWEDLR